MKKSVSVSARLAMWTGLFAVLLLCVTEVLCFLLIPDGSPAWPGSLIPAGLAKPVLMAAVAVLIILWSLMLWLGLRRACPKEQEIEAAAAGQEKPGPREPSPNEKKQRLHHDQRLYLHLLSVLQTEGRLLDFLNEDLEQYEDGQIGAAARGIHAHCKAALARYVTLQPLSSQGEGETVSVPAGFDPGAYRLSGNVTGDPPFSGKLLHRGWRAGKLDLPGFSFSGDPEIIAPMEIGVE
ncbi:MAG: DUF2760 domain-containing protein [Thermodesulfobacteriota bacterium]